MKLQWRLALPLFAVAVLVTAMAAVGMVLFTRSAVDAVLSQSGRQFGRITENILEMRANELAGVAAILGSLEGDIGTRSGAWKHTPLDAAGIYKRKDGMVVSSMGARVGIADLRALKGRIPQTAVTLATTRGPVVAGFAPDQDGGRAVFAAVRLDRGFTSELARLLQAEVEVESGGVVLASSGGPPGFREGFYPVETVLTSPAEQKVKIRMFMPVERVLAVRRRAFLWTASGGGVLLVLAAFFYWYAVARVTRPIRELTGAVGRMAGGDIGTVAEGDAPAELGVLLRQFNAMARTLNETQRTLVHSAKLSSVGQLVAGVSHELNNPLLALLGHAEHLATKFPDGDPARRKLDIVITEAQRMRRILANLRSFARQSGEEKAPADLNALAAEVLELVGHEAEKAGVECALKPGEGVVAAVSADQIRQVMLNLVLNSLEAMPGGGGLTVRTDSDGQSARVVVSDTGPGIPAEIRDKVMEPFFTTRPGKTGIGLSICQEIAARHGGRIIMESEMGKGTRVTLEVPSQGCPKPPSPVPRERES